MCAGLPSLGTRNRLRRQPRPRHQPSSTSAAGLSQGSGRETGTRSARSGWIADLVLESWLASRKQRYSGVYGALSNDRLSLVIARVKRKRLPWSWCCDGRSETRVSADKVVGCIEPRAWSDSSFSSACAGSTGRLCDDRLDDGHGECRCWLKPRA